MVCPYVLDERRWAASSQCQITGDAPKRWDGRRVICVDPLLDGMPTELREALGDMHRRDALLYAAADADAARRFAALGAGGAAELAELRRRKGLLLRGYQPLSRSRGGDSRNSRSRPGLDRLS